MDINVYELENPLTLANELCRSLNYSEKYFLAVALKRWAYERRAAAARFDCIAINAVSGVEREARAL